MHGAVDGERVVLDIIAALLYVPCEVIPGVGLEIGSETGNVGGSPAGVGGVVPDVPFAVGFEVAFRAPDSALAAIGLIQIELQCLRSVGIVDVEIKIVDEVRDVIAAGDGIEV